MAKRKTLLSWAAVPDAILTNNGIPHISIYITAPIEQRIQRAIEVNSGLDRKKRAIS